VGRDAGDSGDRREDLPGSKWNKADREAAGAMHRVSAFSTERGLGLAEVVAEEKSNEIPAVRDLLDIRTSGAVSSRGMR
jgi:hypothetical protein